MLIDRGADINHADDEYGITSLYIACQEGRLEVVKSLLARGALINQAMDGALTPLSGLCEKGYLAISELLIASHKFEGYTPDQLKKIICSCVANHHADSPSAMSYCMIGYQCYKYLDDPNYVHDVQKQSAIDRGQQEKVRQTKILVSLFVSQKKSSRA